MMNQLQVFNNEEFGEMRTILLDGEPMFNLDDVSFALGYTDNKNGVLYLRRGRIAKVLENGSVLTFRHSGEDYINEEGIYEFMFESRTEKSRNFRKWVASAVLPTMRKAMQSLQLVDYTPPSDSLVVMRDGFCYTTSNQIATTFDRDHKDVLRIIDGYLKEVQSNERKNTPITTTGDFMRSHVTETTYLDSRNRVQKSYELDEYAFSMVALSFTGKKAEQFKIAFIEEFFKMRQVLLDRTRALAIEQVLPQKKNLRQYVYLIRNEGSNNIKIGVAQNPEQRLKQLQTGADADLTLEYKSMVCSNAYEIETYMHQEFKEYNVRNEWFDCDLDMLTDELDQCEYVLESDFSIKL